MEIVKSDQLKIKILKMLAKAKEDLSYYALMKQLNMKDSTFYPNCQFLRWLDFVKVKDIYTPNSRTYHYITITQKGRTFLEKIKTGS